MSTSTSHAERRSGSEFPVAAALSVGAIALAASVAMPADWNLLLSVFGWRDVALVCFLAAVPLAATIVAGLRRFLPDRVLPPAGVFLLAALALVVFRGPSAGGVALRSLLSVGGPLCGLLILSPMISPRRPAIRRADRGIAAAFVTGALAFAVLPQIYIGARCHHDAEVLEQYLEQSRLGEARGLAARLSILNPSALVAGEPVSEVVRQLNTAVEQLKAELKAAPAARATPDEVVSRAERLAILGERDDAIALLDRLARPRSAAAENLLGTIYESRNEWDAGLRAYTLARSAAVEVGSSAADRGELLRSLLGMAYCRRKLGALPEAERLYLDALAIAPTAETHFLLAQFYEDTQRADRARVHARQAMLLEPSLYGDRGRKLIDKLLTVHFGCLKAYREENR